MILDDPAFLADIPALDFDLNFDNVLNIDSQHSLVSSVRSRSGSGTQLGIQSSQNNMLEIHIPSSAPRGTPAYRLPPMPFGSSAHKTPSAAGYAGGINNISHSYDEDGMGLLDELDFEFDADGGMVEGDAEERARVRSGAAPRASRNYAGIGRADSAASDRVRQEHEDALVGRLDRMELNLDEDGDFNMMQMEEDLVLPDADAFQPQPRQRVSSEHLTSELSEVPTPGMAEFAVPVKKKRAKVAPKKAITDTEAISYRNADFRSWQENYANNMATQRDAKRNNAIKNHAKANADVFLFGNGIGGIGRVITSVSNGAAHPLAWLQGDMLRNLIVGEPTSPSSPEQARKRRLSVSSTVEADEQARKRRHSEEDPEAQRGHDEELPPLDDDLALLGLDDSAEMGRDAPTPLAEHQSSAMPWNVSSSLKSFRAGDLSLPRPRGVRASSIVSHRAGPPSRVSAQSPLVGRGRLLSDFEDIRRDESPSPPERGRDQFTGTSDNAILALVEDEFEMHGPAAAVDTQTAGNSQWLAEALETESYNFLEFVKNTAMEIEIDEEIIGADVEGEVGKTWVGFEKMFPPKHGTTKIVAAQAFYHVLSLATKNLLGVKQEYKHEQDIGAEVRMFVKV